MRSFARRFGVVIYMAVTACQSDKPLAPSLTGPSRAILPSPPEGSTSSVFVGDSIQLSSKLSTKRKNTITWSSSSSTVVRVTNKGLATAAGAGSATITASNSTGTEHWSFTVSQRIASITVTPNPVSVAVGANVTLAVTLKASDGSVLTGRPISYQSLNTALATVSSGGVVAGVSNGTTSVVVTAGTTNNIVSSTVPVAVGSTSPPPDTGALGLNAALTRAFFPADNPWNTPIDTASVDPNSAAIISNIGLTTSFHPDFGANYNGGPFGIPYVVVSGTQARVNVTFDYADESDPGPYPIPPNPPIEPGSDAHILMVDRDNWKLYELFAAQRNTDGSWHAGLGRDLRPLVQRAAAGRMDVG